MQKLKFQTFFINLTQFEEFLYDNDIFNLSLSEIQSITIDSMPGDIWQIEAYIGNHEDKNNLKNQLIKFSASNKLAIINEQIDYEEILNKDWAKEYEKSLKPIEIDRFFISARIHKDHCPENKIGIFIDSSQAFGTGDHATTSGCIKSLVNQSGKNFPKILDLGCGTGILSFIAKKLWPTADVTACDIDPIAVELAQVNAKFNELQINIFQNDNELVKCELNNEQFDLIICNILAEPLINYAEIISKLTKDNALIILAGFLENQAQKILDIYKSYGFNLINQRLDNTWVILTLQKKI